MLCLAELSGGAVPIPPVFFLTMQYAVVIASIGALAFIVFAMPKSFTARPRAVIGGQLTGLFSGYLCSLFPNSSLVFSILAYSLAVGLSLFLMVALGTEHPLLLLLPWEWPSPASRGRLRLLL